MKIMNFVIAGMLIFSNLGACDFCIKYMEAVGLNLENPDGTVKYTEKELMAYRVGVLQTIQICKSVVKDIHSEDWEQ